MLFGETFAGYCENHAEHADALCGQNVEFYFVKGGGIIYTRLIVRASELLYDWRFTVNQFVLATSLLRLTSNFFSTEHLRL
jgi:hypothetical protein